ncbi:MAG: hypothetical protein SGPRY_008590, partial [Prymnesium sp.]
EATDGAKLMERVLSWLPGMLVKLELGDEPEEGEDAADNDSEFVDMARPWCGSALAFLTAEGGSLLLLLPAAENEKDTFDQIVAAVRLTARCVQPPTNRRGSHAEGLGMREVWHSRGLGSGLVQDLGG